VLLETVLCSFWLVADQDLVVLAHKFVVIVFRVFMPCLWKKKLAGCWVEGAAALGM